MSRKDPAIAAPKKIKMRENLPYITQIRKYKLLTPLYGGGVEPSKPDPITVVRATEVRGHLRFWWRATRGGAYSSIDEMRRKEEQIWGSTEKSSEISVLVGILNEKEIMHEPAFRIEVTRNHGKRKVKIVPSSEIAPYAAFPLLPDKEEQKQDNWVSEEIFWNVNFFLQLSYPEEEKKELEAALWAWETFGGIGARTRRGFGALQLEAIENDGIESKTFVLARGKVRCSIEEGLKNNLIKTDQWLAGVPHLSNNIDRYRLIDNERIDSVHMWKKLIKSLYQFRQKRYGSKYGKSQWPEANEIRRIFNKDPKIADDLTEASLVEKFPRAVFGLPILFHMPKDDLTEKAITLQGVERPNNEKYDRLASPLILRPVACDEGAVGLAAILEWDPVDSNEPYTPPGGLMLKNAPGNPGVDSQLTKDNSKHIAPLNGNPDVLAAFLDFLT